MFDPKKLARLICGNLLPHTTSVKNVDMIAQALQEARVFGRNEVYAERQRPRDNMDRMDGG